MVAKSQPFNSSAMGKFVPILPVSRAVIFAAGKRKCLDVSVKVRQRENMRDHRIQAQ